MCPDVGSPKSDRPKEKLGQVLKRMNVLTEKHIQEALMIQLHSGGRIGEILVRLNYVSQEEVEIALTFQAGAVLLKEEEIFPGDPDFPTIS
jgi:hypothetical protein